MRFLASSLIFAATLVKVDATSYPNLSILSSEEYCFSGRSLNSGSCPSTPEYEAMLMSPGDVVHVSFDTMSLTEEGRHHNYDDDNDGNDGGLMPDNRRRLDSATDVTLGYIQVYLQPLEKFPYETGGSLCVDNKFRNEIPFTPEVTDFTPPSFIDTSLQDYIQIALPLNPSQEDIGKKIDALTLSPKTKGLYLVLISNCVTNPNNPNLIPTFKVKEFSIVWQFAHGYLPYHLLGLIPFYAIFGSCYSVLLLLWVKQTMTFGWTSFLGLQKAICYLILTQVIFSWLALSYYLHLNNTPAKTLQTLYSGTEAAMISPEEKDLWSFLVGVSHFVSIFSCQLALTFAADGTWLINHQASGKTKFAVIILMLSWLIFILFYDLLGLKGREVWYAVCGSLWLCWLVFSVKSSMRQLQALTVGDSSDPIAVAHPGAKDGDMLTAKRSLFRKLCVLLGAYPIVFLISVVLSTQHTKPDSWAPWIGYVITDIYIFIMLVHATYLWLPRPREDLGKYAPIGESEESFDGDFGLTQIGVGEDETM